MKIRNYSLKDYFILFLWWQKTSEPVPTNEMLPEESTFVVELNEEPIMAVTLYLTNSKEFCMVDNFIADPAANPDIRKEATRQLLKYIAEFAEKRGFKKLFCLSRTPGLSKYYKKIGFFQTGKNLDTFIKEL